MSTKFEDESVVADEHNAYKNEEYTCPICQKTHNAREIEEQTWWLVVMINCTVQDVCDECFYTCLESGAIMRDYSPRSKSDYKMS